MKKVVFHIGTCFLCAQLSGQEAPALYHSLVKKADSLYNIKEYKKSALAYSSAFKEYGWKGFSQDRYNAACSWALAGVPDSAFFNLFRLAERAGYTNLSQLKTDNDLISLKKDKRWEPVLIKVKENKDKAEQHLNKPLVWQLDSIHETDQYYRRLLSDSADKYGWQSKQVQEIGSKMTAQDKINLIKVKAILDTHGWLGPEEVGQEGNTTLFLVIQHSDQETQEKYLPMMREAVNNKKASGSHLALLEDRVALGQGKKQIYGSQVGNKADGVHYVLPLEDPEHVDERRAKVGLPPMKDYLMNWNMVWDVEAYKKSAQN